MSHVDKEIEPELELERVLDQTETVLGIWATIRC